MRRTNLFKELDLQNDVSRSGFNLGHKRYFTAKCGELLPVYHKSVIPGDSFKMSVNHFTRTAPVETASYTQFREYFDWFFVPYRILGKQIPQILAKNTQNPSVASSSSTNQPVASKLPFVSLNDLFGQSETSGKYVKTLLGKTNEFGFNRGKLSAKMLDLLGYAYLSDSNSDALLNNGNYIIPYRENLEVTLLPLMSYQKIYYDFFRNSQWEDNVPYNYNVDYMGSSMRFYVAPTTSGGAVNPYYDNPTIFDLRYANYPKDLFMGLLPNSQYGDESVMEVDYDGTGTFLNLQDSRGNNIKVGNGNVDGFEEQYSIEGSPAELRTGDNLGVNLVNGLNSLRANISVLEARKARALQKYKEIIGSGSIDYQTIIRKIFNVEVPDELSDHCIYLGGSSSTLSISEVENTNLAGDNKSLQRGKGVSSANGDMFTFESKEYGVIMCIYHIAPVIDYSISGINFDVVKTDADDYANPVFDRLGFVEFPSHFLTNGNHSSHTSSGNVAFAPNAFLGWTSRYFDYKTSIDQVNGDFKGSLQNWLSPVDDDYLFKRGDRFVYNHLDYTFFKINPSICDKIFGVNSDSNVNTDQFRISATFNVNAVRNLDYIGVQF